ncbi:ATP-binding protein [Methanobacterium alcaliphilum]|uniref:ATP-binding protein n=1 Tax=Methanobacterium alcaliphilum TaxID=392018 RepID=UPI00200AEF3D|nr:ATP-binding protein [Methanobacterium alcaliphilum]MCK9151778.1 ATP-binding protein [Methanobacterium alcaliphilum]
MVQKKMNYSLYSSSNNTHKVNSSVDNSIFLPTQSYKKIKTSLENLEKSRGKIVHIVGAPGTGKSTNIFKALDELNLNVYEISTSLSNPQARSKEVFCALIKDLKESLGVATKEEAYKKLSKYDVVLFADQFHDKHLLKKDVIGFSLWTRNVGFKSMHFYLICIREFIKHQKEFRKINIVFQTAWRVRFRGKKYDLFTDFGVFSRIILKILGKLSHVVEIKYNTSETISIVKAHFKDVDEKKIRKYIKKYGCKPRFILQELENEK